MNGDDPEGNRNRTEQRICLGRVPGFVVDCRLDGESRIVTFANGMVVRELIVDVDDRTCRHAWSARTELLIHHNASVQVFAEGPNKCRVAWIADLLPNEAAENIASMIQTGLETMKRNPRTQPGWDLIGDPTFSTIAMINVSSRDSHIGDWAIDITEVSVS